MAETSIEWTDFSTNPIRFGKGHYCQKISPGCTNCYASRFQPRVGNPQFGGTGGKLPLLACTCGADRTGPSAEAHDTDCPAAGPRTVTDHRELWLDESKLQDVLRRRKPTKIFWCDMTDLFGSWVPDEWIDKCFATMALTPQHTHQVLTKRPERMRDYFAMVNEEKDMQRWANHACDLTNSPCACNIIEDCDWPLPNVWLGVSVEDQQRADERIPLLLQTPAAVRFLSCEPLLGEVILGQSIYWQEVGAPGIDWVIVGGESGPGARPMHPDWARSLRDQCHAAGVAFFFKQWGEWAPYSKELSAPLAKRNVLFDGERFAKWDGNGWRANQLDDSGHQVMIRVGKKAAGRMLDGREWSEFPTVQS